MEPQTYEIESGFKRLIFICGLFFLCFVILSAALPFLPDNSPSHRSLSINTISVIGILFFGVFSWYCFKIVRKIPFCSVMVDDEGIWAAHKDREKNLIPWQSITNIKERPYGQRLELIGKDGSTLLRIEYQLAGFNKLRSHLIEQIDIGQHYCMPIRFSKTPVYHLFYFTCFFGFGWLGSYVGGNNPLFGYGVTAFLLLVIGYEYFTSICSLSLDHHCWTVNYPVLSRQIQPEDIITIDMADTFVKGARNPEIHISLKSGKKKIKLKSLGIDSVILYKILDKVIEKKTKQTC